MHEATENIRFVAGCFFFCIFSLMKCQELSFSHFLIASNGMLCWLHSNDTPSIQLEILHWFLLKIQHTKYSTANKIANDINIEERETLRKYSAKSKIFRTMCSEWIEFLMQILSRQIESHFTLALKWGLFILNKYYVSDLHSWYAQYLLRVCFFLHFSYYWLWDDMPWAVY